MVEEQKLDIDGMIQDYIDVHSDMLDRMDDDYDIYTLLPYELDEDSISVTSAEPRRFADKIIGTCEDAKLYIKVTVPPSDLSSSPITPQVMMGSPAIQEPQEERDDDKESTIERLSYGLLASGDKNLRRNRIVFGRTIQSASIFYAGIRGAICNRILLVKDKGKLYTDILPCDPRYFAFGVDKNGMAWGAETTWRPVNSVEEEYGDVEGVEGIGDTYEDVVPVIDFWNREISIIQIGSNNQDYGINCTGPIQQIIQEHKLGRPPFSFIPVGAAPVFYGSSRNGEALSNVVNWCESLYAASRYMYEPRNMVLSVWASLIAKSHKPSYWIFTPNGSMKIEDTPWGMNQAIPLPLEAKVEMVKPPDIAASAPQLYNILDREIQANDLATIEYGLIPGADMPSSKALLTLQSGRQSKVTPILKALNASYEDMCELLIEQYEKQGKKQLWHGYDSKDKQFYQEIEPNDVKKPWDIECRFVVITPEEDIQNLAKAQTLQQMGLPDEYIYEKGLQMQDPDKTRRQKYMQSLDQDPFILKKHQYDAAIKEGHVEEAQKIGFDLMKMMQQLAQPPAPPQGLPQQGPPMPPQPAPQGGFNG